MSIAHELHWTTASKPKFGKATEHSGAKKGKGAWDKKKVAKKGSNKGRRAGGKQEIKDQTVGDESDGPFPGAAPLFKKAAALNWGSNASLLPEWKGIDLRGVSTPALELANSLLDQAIARQAIAEPRPCYPSEEPVKDHCNDSISPPAPGGGDDMSHDDMGTIRPTFDNLTNDVGVSPEYTGNPDNEGFEDPDDTLERIWKAQDKIHPQLEEDQYQRHQNKQQEIDDRQEDMDLYEESQPQLGDDDYDDPSPGDNWEELDELQDPMDTEPQGEGAPLVPEQAPAPGPLQGDPHGPRDPSLGPDAPHQFWSQEQPHIQDALNKYLIPQLDSPKPGVADKARRILMEGPHAE